jgi:hypothetical protein
MSMQNEALEQAVVAAALDLSVATMAHAFSIPVPDTTPPLYVSLHEGPVQLRNPTVCAPAAKQPRSHIVGVNLPPVNPRPAAPPMPRALGVKAIDPIRAALAELVACKDLKERADKISPVEPGCEKEVLMDEYRRRQPLAWKAARAALAACASGVAMPRVTDAEVTRALERHCLRTDSAEARKDMRKALEGFLADRTAGVALPDRGQQHE